MYLNPCSTAGEDTFIAQLVEHNAAHQLVEDGRVPRIRAGEIFSGGRLNQRTAEFWRRIALCRVPCGTGFSGAARPARHYVCRAQR